MLADVVAAVEAGVAAHDGALPYVVGIAGGVGVGKTTLAGELADALTAAGHAVSVLATDSFLHPNDELSRRGLLMQKGFPETYRTDLLAEVIGELRTGNAAEVPVYDHQTYDVLAERRTLAPPHVLVLEGVNVLQPDVAALVDLAIYVDVAEADAEAWFHERFQALCEAGEGFYASMAAMSPAERRAIAASAWDGINLVNLRTHIAPTSARAHVVVRKDDAHRIVAVVTVAPD